jgi:hypothetical protein
VNLEHVKNLNDIKLLQAGWIFDINFQPARDIIGQRRYIEMIREALPASKKIDDIFSILKSEQS